MFTVFILTLMISVVLGQDQNVNATDAENEVAEKQDPPMTALSKPLPSGAAVELLSRYSDLVAALFSGRPVHYFANTTGCVTPNRTPMKKVFGGQVDQWQIYTDKLFGYLPYLGFSVNDLIIGEKNKGSYITNWIFKNMPL